MCDTVCGATALHVLSLSSSSLEWSYHDNCFLWLPGLDIGKFSWLIFEGTWEDFVEQQTFEDGRRETLTVGAKMIEQSLLELLHSGFVRQGRTTRKHISNKHAVWPINNRKRVSECGDCFGRIAAVSKEELEYAWRCIQKRIITCVRTRSAWPLEGNTACPPAVMGNEVPSPVHDSWANAGKKTKRIMTRAIKSCTWFACYKKHQSLTS